MSADRKPRIICLVAGDVSGDQNGGRLAAAIRQLAPDVRLVGAGGSAMREAGVEVEIETTQFSVVGFLDALRTVRQLVAVYRRVQALVTATEPHVVVLIDSETVMVPFARWLRRRGVPAVFFFPPQVWFWGRWRRHWVRRLARRVISAFAPEADLYRRTGVDTVWAGHPLVDVVHVHEDAALALREIGLDPARPLVALMPGSRRREINALLSPMLAAAGILQTRNPALQFALPLASESFRSEVELAVRESGVHDIAIYRPQSYAVLSHAQVALQCSGTATLETALLGVPSVIVYRLHPIEYFFARHVLMHVEFIGMPNLLLGEMVQPELFHKNVTPERLADEVWSLLSEPSRHRGIQLRLARIRELLGPRGVFPRAAQAVTDLLPPAVEHQQFAVGS
jgi:lipid-A-disaccharide synthase